MKLNEFIKSTINMLNLDDLEVKKKKKSIKQLLKKLEIRKLKLEKTNKKEDLELINFQINKGKKLLEKFEKRTSN